MTLEGQSAGRWSSFDDQHHPMIILSSYDHITRWARTARSSTHPAATVSMRIRTMNIKLNSIHAQVLIFNIISIIMVVLIVKIIFSIVIIMTMPSGAAWQKWDVVGKTIRNRDTGRCLDIQWVMMVKMKVMIMKHRDRNVTFWQLISRFTFGKEHVWLKAFSSI